MNKDFILAGLRKQQDRLNELINQFAVKQGLEESDFYMYDKITKQIEKELSQIKKGVSAL